MQVTKTAITDILRLKPKLVRVAQGEVFDVAVIRPESLTHGKWIGDTLSASDKRQLWMQQGLVERCIAWNAPTSAIQWLAMSVGLKLSGKDMAGYSFENASRRTIA